MNANTTAFLKSLIHDKNRNSYENLLSTSAFHHRVRFLASSEVLEKSIASTFRIILFVQFNIYLNQFSHTENGSSIFLRIFGRNKAHERAQLTGLPHCVGLEIHIFQEALIKKEQLSALLQHILKLHT